MKLISSFSCSENLRFLFRSVSVTRVDTIQIVSMEFHANGFARAREVAVKIVTFFRLAEQLLSPQTQRHFGMRSIKIVMRATKKKLRELGDGVDEEIALCNVICDNHLSELHGKDLEIFRVKLNRPNICGLIA